MRWCTFRRNRPESRGPVETPPSPWPDPEALGLRQSGEASTGFLCFSLLVRLHVIKAQEAIAKDKECLSSHMHSA